MDQRSGPSFSPSACLSSLSSQTGYTLVSLWGQGQKCPPSLTSPHFYPLSGTHRNLVASNTSGAKAVVPLQEDATCGILPDPWYQSSPKCKTLVLAGCLCVCLLKSGFRGRSEDNDKSRMWVRHSEVRDTERGWEKRLKVGLAKWKDCHGHCQQGSCHPHCQGEHAGPEEGKVGAWSCSQGHHPVLGNTQCHVEEDAGIDVEDSGHQNHLAEGTSKEPVEVQCRFTCPERGNECQPRSARARLKTKVSDNRQGAHQAQLPSTHSTAKFPCNPIAPTSP